MNMPPRLPSTTFTEELLVRLTALTDAHGLHTTVAVPDRHDPEHYDAVYHIYREQGRLALRLLGYQRIKRHPEGEAELVMDLSSEARHERDRWRSLMHDLLDVE
jgi:hypothetical protein